MSNLDANASVHEREDAQHEVGGSRTGRRLATRVVAGALAAVLGWELVGYVGSADGSLSDWLLPLAAALIVQMTLVGWRLRQDGTPTLLTLLSIVGPSILLALISARSPRADVVYFLGSLLAFAGGQFVFPIEFPTRGDTAGT